MNRTKPDRKTGQGAIAFDTFERIVNLICETPGPFRYNALTNDRSGHQF